MLDATRFPSVGTPTAHRCPGRLLGLSGPQFPGILGLFPGVLGLGSPFRSSWGLPGPSNPE
eukprot:5774975-Alexandrium_andersonii.AAC.1